MALNNLSCPDPVTCLLLSDGENLESSLFGELECNLSRMESSYIYRVYIQYLGN